MKRLERTRSDILDAAWNLIRIEGADVSLAQVAKAAGISRQSVYDHFGSRGGMIIEMVRRVDERLEIRESLFAAFNYADPKTRLTKTLDAWFDFVIGIYPVATDLIRLRATDKDAAAAWEDRMSELKGWLVQLTQSLKADGALKPEWTAKTAAEYLWASSSVQAWGLLTEDCGWSERKARRVLKQTICGAVLGLEGDF